MGTYLDVVAAAQEKFEGRREQTDARLPAHQQGLLDYGIAIYLLSQLQISQSDRTMSAARVGGMCKAIAEACGYDAGWSRKLSLAAQLASIGYRPSSQHRKATEHTSERILDLLEMLVADRYESLRFLGSRTQEETGKIKLARQAYELSSAFDVALEKQGKVDREALHSALRAIEIQAHRHCPPVVLAALRDVVTDACIRSRS